MCVYYVGIKWKNYITSRISLDVAYDELRISNGLSPEKICSIINIGVYLSRLQATVWILVNSVKTEHKNRFIISIG
jgi:hypothetical protein